MVNCGARALTLTRKDDAHRIAEIDGIPGPRIIVTPLSVAALDGKTPIVSEISIDAMGADVIHMIGTVPDGRKDDLRSCLQRKSSGFDVCFKLFCLGALSIRREGITDAELYSFEVRTYMPMTVNMQNAIRAWAK